MGNCVSASLEINAPKIRVVQAVEGRVVDIEVPTAQDSIKVGELMLEFAPGHFVAQLDKADFLATAPKRAAPLGADADTKPGSLYVLFPMPRLHTRITPQEFLTFAKLLHLHDDQRHFAKAASTKVTASRLSLFTAGARVAPLAEEDLKDDSLNGGDNTEQQQDEQEAMCSSSLLVRPCHGQMQVINKSKPWAPKLETIKESS